MTTERPKNWIELRVAEIRATAPGKLGAMFAVHFLDGVVRAIATSEFVGVDEIKTCTRLGRELGDEIARIPTGD